MAFTLNGFRVRKGKVNVLEQDDATDRVRLNFGLAPGNSVVRFVKRETDCCPRGTGKSKIDGPDQ